MKLIQKTFLYYLVYSLFIFTIGTVVFYFSIKKVLFDGIDEALHQEKIQLMENLNYEKDFNYFEESDVLKISKIASPQKVKDIYSTVSLKDSTTLESIDFRELHSIVYHNGQYYDVIIRQSLTEAETLINSILPIEVFLFIGLIIGILVINRVISKKIWEPFYILLNKLSDYNPVHHSVILSEPSNVFEFDELNKNIERMTRKIHQDYVSQKEFHEHSSHELQTPLAIIRNKLELLIQSKNLSEEELNYVSSIFDTIRRLSSLNKNLLLLSKIENNQFIETQSVSLDILLHKQLNHLQEIIHQKGVTLYTAILPDVVIKANEVLIETLCYNLLSNAINHNIPNGTMEVILNHDYLKIANTGNKSTMDTSRLFERFQKGDTSSTSVGLGLSIVKKIAEGYKFKLTYTINEGMHLIRVDFN
ncbi:MAG: HAMP domain-containing histidine kinase [Cytophagaceae bacterium]|jgi:signal transduction histidine kinase|nr:HAMP domain-containing histidine kinase [Cytophagaceae bacterium]